MNTYTFSSYRLLAMLAAATLLHSQFAFAGCDLPMFAGARMFGTGGNAGMFVTADFNHDGITDLAVISNTAGNVAILLGNGDGTFQPAQTVAKGKPQGLAAGDFNGDGKVDLAVSDGNSFKIMMLLGNGDGTFKSPILAGGQSSPSMAVGDFNKDGKLDLAIIGIPAYILLGNGDGTFGSPIAPAGNSLVPGEGVDVGDFNGDGKLDVAVGGPSGLSVMLGDGTGHLSAPVTMAAGAIGTTSVKVADVNGDHKPDLVSFDPFGFNMIVVLGNGDGTFQAPVNYAIPAQLVPSANLVVTDLTGDGIPDIAICGEPALPNSPFGLVAVGTVLVYPGVGDGTFQSPVQYNSGYYSIWWMASGDFNGDGLPDLAFSDITNAASAPTQVGIMLGNPNGTLQSPSRYPVTDTPRTPVLADFNGDGALDMAVVNTGFTSPGLSVLLGNGDGTFQSATNYSTSFGPQALAAGDVNGDGKMDLVVANSTSIVTYLGNGDGTFKSPISNGASFGAYYVALGDFNGDGKLDAAIGSGAGGVQIYPGKGDGTFGNGSFPLSSCIGCSGNFVAVADLNGDGKLDLVVPNANFTTPNGLFASGTVTVYLGNGDGSFQSGVAYTAGLNAVFAAIGDFNGDGKPDLAVADVGGNQINQSNPGALAVLLGNGDGTFQKAVRYAAPLGSSWVATGDFNGDGYADIAVGALTTANGNAVSSLTVFLSNPDGTLRNPLTYGAGGSPLGVTVGDLNADGKPDLVYVDLVTASVGVMLNSYIPGSTGSACIAAPLTSN